MSVGMPGEEPIRGRNLVSVDLVIGGLDIDQRIFSFVRGIEAWKHLALIDLVAPPGDLLSTVSTQPRNLGLRALPAPVPRGPDRRVPRSYQSLPWPGEG